MAGMPAYRVCEQEFGLLDDILADMTSKSVLTARINRLSVPAIQTFGVSWCPLEQQILNYCKYYL